VPPWFYLDGAALTLHASSVRTKPLVEWAATSRRTTVRFRDTHFPEAITAGTSGNLGQWITNPGTTGCFYSFERCDADHNIPFDDLVSSGAW
jgi:hypothetical protein